MHESSLKNRTYFIQIFGIKYLTTLFLKIDKFETAYFTAN